MLAAGTNVKCAWLERFVGFRFFDTNTGELRELRRVLRGERSRHVLHQNDRSRKIASEAGGQAHDRRRTASRCGQHDNRETLIGA